MPNSISPVVTMAPPRNSQLVQSEVAVAVLEAPALDPETRSRLLQLGHPMRNAARAATARAALVVQLKEQALGTLGPPHTEVLLDPAALEEFNRKKQKEITLASSLCVALDDSLRTQADLQKAMTFLLPEIASGLMRNEDVAGALPDSQPLMQNPADADVSGLVWNSHGEFFAQIGELLEVLKNEWLSKYQDSLRVFLKFYEEFADIMEQIKPSASGDKGDVTIDFNQVAHKLLALRDKYSLDENALASFSTLAEADAFVKSMGIPLSITKSPDGTFRVKILMKNVQDLIDSMPRRVNDPNASYPVKWDSARYNAWVSSKDSNMEQIKHVSKVLGEKLNEMTQKYDNIVKILSSSIDKMSEANRAYVQNS